MTEDNYETNGARYNDANEYNELSMLDNTNDQTNNESMRQELDPNFLSVKLPSTAHQESGRIMAYTGTTGEFAKD